MRLFKNADFPLIEKRRAAYAVSGLMILVGIAAMIANVFTIGSWVNYGVDFLGGSLVQVRFEDPDITVNEIRAALSDFAPEVSRFGGEEDHEFQIRAPLDENASITEVRQAVETRLREGLPGAGFEVRNAELVSAKVGSELQTKALLAVLFSLAMTLVYLAFRFETRFGIAAVVAVAHDILVALGFIALFRMEVSLTTVAAILTVLGYSLNDTIVVFDRIRENMHRKGARKRDYHELVNRSINETLPRTVLTSATTLVVLLSLLLLGGAVIRDFALVLTLGILVGTYSSIFVASPALIEIQKRWGMGTTKEKKPRPEPATV